MTTTPGRPDPAAVSRPVGRAGLCEILGGGDFRRLLATRLASQCADGVFQASLAGAVLFNPDHAAEPAQVAAGFAVLLLPYSLVGPFAGVILDRWSRQRVLVVANAVRCLLVALVAAEIAGDLSGPAFYASALVAISVNRFVLAGLSAALPHVVCGDQLVTANAVSTTLGTAATTAGAGAALLVRSIVGSGNHGYAAITLASALGYAGAALAVGGFPRDRLGPDAAQRGRRESARQVVAGFVAGARHVIARRPAAYALAVISTHRFFYGISTIATLLLYRNYFHTDGVLRAGLAGLGQVLAVGAAGSLVAAVVTPAATRRLGKPVWITTLLAVAALTEVVFGLPYTMAALLGGAFLLGIAAQGVKISVDTTVQQNVDDEFRGRVFSVYDTLFNLMFVCAVVVGAFTLPITGRSYPMLGVIAAGYAMSAVAFGFATAWLDRTSHRPRG